MDFVPLLLMTALVKKVVDLVKYATSGDINAVVTQLVAWLVGIGVTFAAASSDWAENTLVNGQPLSTLNGWGIVLVGVNLASLAGFGWDTIKAIDGSNSAIVPDLLAHPGPKPEHQPVPPVV